MVAAGAVGWSPFAFVFRGAIRICDFVGVCSVVFRNLRMYRIASRRPSEESGAVFARSVDGLRHEELQRVDNHDVFHRVFRRGVVLSADETSDSMAKKMDSVSGGICRRLDSYRRKPARRILRF